MHYISTRIVKCRKIRERFPRVSNHTNRIDQGNHLRYNFKTRLPKLSRIAVDVPVTAVRGIPFCIQNVPPTPLWRNYQPLCGISKHWVVFDEVIWGALQGWDSLGETRPFSPNSGFLGAPYRAQMFTASFWESCCWQTICDNYCKIIQNNNFVIGDTVGPLERSRESAIRGDQNDPCNVWFTSVPESWYWTKFV